MRRPRCGRSGRLWARETGRVRAIGSSLGADIPHFFEGGTALGLDRGDLLFPLVDAPRAWSCWSKNLPFTRDL
mgnify:CR=1 FL=1